MTTKTKFFRCLLYINMNVMNWFWNLCDSVNECFSLNEWNSKSHLCLRLSTNFVWVLMDKSNDIRTHLHHLLTLFNCKLNLLSVDCAVNTCIHLRTWPPNNQIRFSGYTLPEIFHKFKFLSNLCLNYALYRQISDINLNYFRKEMCLALIILLMNSLTDIIVTVAFKFKRHLRYYIYEKFRFIWLGTVLPFFSVYSKGIQSLKWNMLQLEFDNNSHKKFTT